MVRSLLSRSRLFINVVCLGAFSAVIAGCVSEGSFPGVPPLDLGIYSTPDAALMYGPNTREPFPIPAAKLSSIKPIYYRQKVPYQATEKAGTIVVDTGNRFLYLVHGDGTAMRYGIGIGRAGFAWSGRAHVKVKRKWPKWFPPAEMIAREPELAEYRNGMEPGLKNPLGSRALYIYQGNKDTLYRIHGTYEAWSIGRAVSSGCIRMLNQDIIDLYERVPVGAPIVVL